MTFTVVTNTPFPLLHPRDFGDRLSEASNLPSGPPSRMATPTEIHLQVKALRLQERRLKYEQRLLREAVQAAKIDLQTGISQF